MSFNENQFNNGRFNVVQSENVIMLSVEAYEKVDCITASSQKIFLLCVPHEGVGIRIHGTALKHFETEAHETIGWNISLEGSYWLDVQSGENIHTETAFYVILFVYGITGEKITHDRLKIAWNRWLKSIGLENNTGSFTVCSKHFIVTEGGELVSQVATAITVEEILCLINTTLQPGQKLIIDAGTYNVLIDGENAIYTQQGEWLDELNRNTIDITITARNANKKTLENLSASILYTERYL